jgi:hypothetical protein
LARRFASFLPRFFCLLSLAFPPLPPAAAAARLAGVSCCPCSCVTACPAALTCGGQYRAQGQPASE